LYAALHDIYQAYLKVLQLPLVSCNGGDQPVSLVFKLRPLLPYNLTQQLVFKALRNKQTISSSD
jgi:hypothetical protein